MAANAKPQEPHEATMYALRPATAADSAFVYHVHKGTMQDNVTKTWEAWDEVFQIRMFPDSFDPAKFQIMVVNGQDVGLVAIERRPTELFLRTIEILPPYQGRGLGTALLTSILMQAQAENLPVALQVLKVNPARHLYARLGFSVIGATDTHYRMRTMVPSPAVP